MEAQLQGLEGVQGLSDTFVAFVKTVRLFLRDHAHLNRLISGEESSDRMIVWAVVDFLSDFNQTPPPLGAFTLEQLLEINCYRLCRDGTVIALLESVAMLQTRNRLNFSDGGINVSVEDRGPELLQWVAKFEGRYERSKREIKVSLNIQGMAGAGGVFSEFSLIQSSLALIGGE